MRVIALLALVLTAACSDPLGTLFGNRYALDVAATACWSAFSVDFAVDAGGIGEWAGGGRVVADSGTPTEARFFPPSGGRGADYVRGTFTDPHGIMTGGGDCEGRATLARI